MDKDERRKELETKYWTALLTDAALISAMRAAPMRYRDMAKTDIYCALKAFPHLQPENGMLEYPDKIKRKVVALVGTLPVDYDGANYNLPVCLYLLDTHPYNAPVCYVRPTDDMMVKSSQFVDQSAKIYLPYLSDWTYPECNLAELLQVMVVTFQENCPVFAAEGRQPQQDTASPAATSHPVPYTLPWAMVQQQEQTPHPSCPTQPTCSTCMQPTSNTSTSTYSIPPYPSYPAYSTSGSSPGSYPLYPPQTATNTTYSSQQSAGSGTIQPEHIRASLLSAIEDKFRRRLRDTLGPAHFELESIRRMREDLNHGDQRLKSMLEKLNQQQLELESQLMMLVDKKTEIEKRLTAADEEMKIDDAIDTSTPLHGQLFWSVVEDNTIEDAIYYFGQALERGEMNLDIYLRHVRRLTQTVHAAIHDPQM